MHMISLLSRYLYVGFRLMPGLNRIINHTSNFKSVIPSVNRVHQEYVNIVSKNSFEDVSEFKFNESISFIKVHFKYLNTEKNALSNINLKIFKGECIGVIGATGSGKSTLIDLLLGLLRPTSGKVLIDEKYQVNALQWHKIIGYVPQSVYLTDDTIEANIAFGDHNIDQSKLNSAIESAQLSKLISSLPNGVKTMVGERGIRLSGGERQRIAIARALYRNPEVLIFDEATSALDSKTETLLMKTINTLSKERTVIMIAHRLTTLKNCDRIIELDRNQIKSIKKYEDIS